MHRSLQLIAQYDAHRNEYTVHNHNLSPEKANAELRRISAQRFALFVIEQRGVHAKSNPDGCEACRGEVERSSHLQPKPKHRRRKS